MTTAPFKKTTTYTIYWNPDGRWNSYHWSVIRREELSEYGGITSSTSSTFLSDALMYPMYIKNLFPATIVIEPSAESKEQARRYYGRILNSMFNETEGEFIGC